MALDSALSSQIGYAIETTAGTAVTVTRFLPLVSEGIDQKIDRLESKAIIAGARVERSQQWAPGNIAVAGPVSHELYNLSVGMLLRACFGGVVTAGVGPYTHTFTPGDLSDDSLTIQVGRTDIAGTVDAFTYAGCAATQWDIDATAGQLVMFNMNIVGMTEVTNVALASASYASGIKPMVFTGASLSIGGTTANCKSLKLHGDNKLDVARRFIGSATIKQPLEADLRDYTGVFTGEFESLTAYNRFVNGTEAALVATFAAGAQTLVFTYNVRFDGDTPNVTNRGIVPQTLPFKAVGATTDAGAITAVWTTTTEATP